MDMKKILQAFDGASDKKPVEGSDDMKKFLNIMEGKGSLNRLTQAESIALNTYTEYKPEVRAVSKPSLIDKYFKEVETEFAESQEQKKEKATQLAERVIEKVSEAGGNYGHYSNLKKHISKAKRPPDSILKLAKSGARLDNKMRRMHQEESDLIDTVTVDIPLLLRIMEYAKEDAKDDMDLHDVAERLVELSKKVDVVNMDHYDSIIGKVEEAHPNSKIYDKCWTGYKKVPGKKRGEPGSCEKK